MRSSAGCARSWTTAGDARIDYIALVDPETLAPVGQVHGRTLAALAVWIENTRLIDNCFLEAAEAAEECPRGQPIVTKICPPSDP